MTYNKFLKMMPMSSNKRKGRMSANSNKPSRQRLYCEKNMAHDGVYGNLKMMYAAASLVGSVVQVQVLNGAIWEGVLRTFSNQFELVLEMAHKVNPNCSPMKGISLAVSNLISSFPFEGGFFEKIIFKMSDVVLLKAYSVDTDFAVKDNFTDTAISKFNGQIKERELEPWEGAGSDTEVSQTMNIEDDDGTNGWDANDMFRTNAEKYGVKSSYDNSLQDYTVALTKKDTEEYKLQEARASKIALEIEGNTFYQSRIQLENGDEEDRFSAVVRPDDSASSKYVLPQKRRNIPGPKRQPTIPSPVHTKTYSSSHSSLPIQGKSYQQVESPPSPGEFPNSLQCSPNFATGTAIPKNGSVKTPVDEMSPASDISKTSSTVENVPILSGPPKMQVLGPQSLPPRIERQRENEKKLSKQKGRTDEIEEFKKFSTHFKLTEENKECEGVQGLESKVDPSELAAKVERVKISKEEEKPADVLKFSNLNPNAKEFVFNPNAKSFVPRSMPATTSQPPLQPIQNHSPPVMTVQHSQMIQNLPQPIFTAMAPQYIMQSTPVSVAITSPFAPSNMQQTQRFRKVPITMQHRHDFTPSMHVAAATGQPILAQAAPSQLTMQYTSPPGVIHASGPPQQTMGYPQMNFVVGPRVVSPQPMGMIQNSPTVSYCDTSHLPTHLIMSAHSGVSHSAASTPHPLQQGQHPNHPPPQSQTPVLHPAPSPVHQVPTQPNNHSQPPTPTAVMYQSAGALSQHPLQVAGHHSHGQQINHHPVHQHHPGFPTGPQPMVLMQQQPMSASHHSHHHHHHPIHMHTMHPQNQGSHIGAATHILPQMTLIPTSAAMTSAPSIATPPYVQHQ